ncbi:hypothetical protein K7432_018327 [Basidiobolus ranarum]|uniref:Ubiquitin-like protease family profile domain-containing protein n=1 Tax=Basidiobolus ranarum TaxID=34480 RepID=A0ABR2VJ55_9FUNG
MNFYGNLIMERAKQSQSSYPEIHVFNTFFYSTLRDKGYQQIRRWSRKFNIFKKDYIIIPVHLGMHWVCAIINFVQKRIEYYDSMHGNNPQCFQLLRHYLEEESLDKLGQPFDLSDWIDYAPKNIPSQQNGFDCGVFTCMFAEYISRNEPFDFNQKHMKYIRRRMIWEIIQKHLVNQ